MSKMCIRDSHTEVGEGGAEEHRREGAVAHGLQIKRPAGAQQFHFLPQGLCLGGAQQLLQLGIVQSYLCGGGLFAVALAGKEENPLLFPVVDALELLAAADGPVDGVGIDAQLPFHFLTQLQRVPGLPVHLVDERCV